MLFCDTSTLAKYYVQEPESAAVRAHLDAEDQVLLSELARAEIVAVFHRQVRERKWSREEFATVVRQFSTDEAVGYWTWVPSTAASSSRWFGPSRRYRRMSSCARPTVCIWSQPFSRVLPRSTPTTRISATERALSV
jgi:uncharacterized protein with PIN domain